MQIEENWPETSSLNHDVSIYLHRIRELGFADSRTLIAGYNLSPGEFDILASLRRSEPPYTLTPGELQRAVLITSGGLTKLLYQLENSNLIKRSVQEHDNRSKLVHLTSKGKRTIEKAMNALLGFHDEWLNKAFTRKEREQLRQLLGKAASALEKKNEKS